jgi:hypothetical protein
MNYVIGMSISMNAGGNWCILIKTSDGVEHHVYDFDKYEDAQLQLKKYYFDIIEV